MNEWRDAAAYSAAIGKGGNWTEDGRIRYAILPYLATVPFHKGRDISPILLRQIAKDIGMTVEEMLETR